MFKALVPATTFRSGAPFCLADDQAGYAAFDVALADNSLARRLPPSRSVVARLSQRYEDNLKAELTMRVLLIIAALVVLFAVAGWITFSRDDSGRSSINLETQEIREDTGHLMQKGSDLLKEAEEGVRPDSTPTEPTSTRNL